MGDGQQPVTPVDPNAPVTPPATDPNAVPQPAEGSTDQGQGTPAEQPAQPGAPVPPATPASTPGTTA